MKWTSWVHAIGQHLMFGSVAAGSCFDLSQLATEYFAKVSCNNRCREHMCQATLVGSIVVCWLSMKAHKPRSAPCTMHSSRETSELILNNEIFNRQRTQGAPGAWSVNCATIHTMHIPTVCDTCQGVFKNQEVLSDCTCAYSLSAHILFWTPSQKVFQSDSLSNRCTCMHQRMHPRTHATLATL